MREVRRRIIRELWAVGRGLGLVAGIEEGGRDIRVWCRTDPPS